jgi:hypothetical protein
MCLAIHWLNSVLPGNYFPRFLATNQTIKMAAAITRISAGPIPIKATIIYSSIGQCSREARRYPGRYGVATGKWALVG